MVQLTHIWRSYLAGVTYSQGRPCLLSLKSKGFRQQAGRRPFPRLCGARRNVTTTLMCLHLNQQALCGPHRRRLSCRLGPLSLSVAVVLIIKCRLLFTPPSRATLPFLFLFLLHHSTTRRAEISPEAAGGGTTETRADVFQRQVNSNSKDIVSEYAFQSKSIF